MLNELLPTVFDEDTTRKNWFNGKETFVSTDLVMTKFTTEQGANVLISSEGIRALRHEQRNNLVDAIVGGNFDDCEYIDDGSDGIVRKSQNLAIKRFQNVDDNSNEYNAKTAIESLHGLMKLREAGFNVVDIYMIIESEEFVYMVMPYIPRPIAGSLVPDRMSQMIKTVDLNTIRHGDFFVELMSVYFEGDREKMESELYEQVNNLIDKVDDIPGMKDFFIYDIFVADYDAQTGEFEFLLIPDAQYEPPI